MTVLSPSLFLLMRLRVRGAVRRVFRRAGRARSAVALALGLLAMVLWLGPSLAAAFMGKRPDPAGALLWGPVILLAVCAVPVLLSGARQAIAFTPAEIDLLFPAPYTRRELLLYKVMFNAAGALLGALLFSVWLLRYGASWPAAYIAIWLMLVFTHLVSTSVSMVRQSIGRRADTRARRLALVLVLAIVVLGAVAAWRAGTFDDFGALALAWRNSAVGSALLMPFEVFVRALTARDLAQFAVWAGAGLAINVALMLLVIRLDALDLEAAAGAGRRAYDRMERARRGAPVASRLTRKLRVPVFPRLSGAGSIAWRQTTTALRASAWTIPVLGLAVAAILLVSSRSEHGRAAPMLVALVPALVIVLPAVMRFDFRSDLDHMDVLKALPVTPMAAALGELATPLVVVTLLQWVLLGAVVLVDPQSAPVVLPAMAAAPPFNAMQLGVENTVFLLYPVRQTGQSPLDIQAIGRNMVLFLARAALILAGGAVSAGAAVLAYYLTESLIVAVIAGWPVLATCAGAAVWSVAWAFRRFDVGTDVPP